MSSPLNSAWWVVSAEYVGSFKTCNNNPNHHSNNNSDSSNGAKGQAVMYLNSDGQTPAEFSM